MIKANVKFFGAEKDQYGMPTPYHSYFVVASPWQSEDSGVASAVSLSSAAPTPNPPHKLVLHGGPEKAFEAMVDVLRALSANQGLTELTHRE